MTKKNVLSIVLALALIAALAVGATLAFFSDEDEATNTFTMGKVDIDLQESGDKGATWTDEGLTFEHLVPGDTTDKMAKVTVAEDSNDCYIAVTVALECEDFDEATGKGFTADEKKALMEQVKAAIDEEKWTCTQNEEDLSFLCVYKDVCAAKDEVTLFEQITLPLGTKTEFANNLSEQTFKLALKAYAVQSDNMDMETFDWYEDMINVSLPEQPVEEQPEPQPEA